MKHANPFFGMIQKLSKYSNLLIGLICLLILSQNRVIQSHPIKLNDHEESKFLRLHAIEHHHGANEWFWISILFIVILVLAGGMFAGLTLGLLSLDLTSLEVLEKSGQAKEAGYARRIKPIRRKGHWLLVTLLLANVVINETLPILTDSVWGGGWPAIVISSTLIVIFGEIIPQAICSRYGLAIGANCARFVQILMYLLYPIAYPISKLLDSILGETEGMTYKRAELKALVSLHERSEQQFGPLSSDEVTIIQAVLDLRDKDVINIMTPLSDVYMLNWDVILDELKVDEILLKGHSRIPVYAGDDRRNIIGMLLTKKLLKYDPQDKQKIKDFYHAIISIPVVRPQMPCFDILNLFQEGRSHMAVVVEDPPERILKAASSSQNPYKRPILNVLGIVTLEDVIEEMIGEEIIDETDLYVDIQRKDLVRRFKSPRVGPTSTPRLGPSLGGGHVKEIGIRRTRSSIDLIDSIEKDRNNIDNKSPERVTALGIAKKQKSRNLRRSISEVRSPKKTSAQINPEATPLLHADYLNSSG